MALRHAELRQNRAHAGIIARIRALIDPHRGDAQRMRRKKDIFECAGVVPRLDQPRLVRGDDERRRAVQVVAFAAERAAHRGRELLDLLRVQHRGKMPRLAVHRAGRVHRALEDRIDLLALHGSFLKCAHTAARQDVLNHFVRHTFSSQINFL